ncbi:BlaI/MecI/CopY family transcriptional regulator [Vicingaceae bacterium]|nr:BlaI/MecI/CopY family transcriptional regulator [Vicingaceae bacterium]MDC1451167.1 BlaI/MecI/CopY family transcriptional regulator [Vicingaceae bacterium]
MQELTKAEEQVMHVLWKVKKAFVKELLVEMDDPKPAYNTVSTIIRILEKKGFVGFTAFGKTHQYYPLVSKEDYKIKISKSLVSKYFEGSFENLVSFFAKKEEINVAELDAILKTLKK